MDTTKNTVYIVRIDIKVGESGYNKILHKEHINTDVFIHHASDFCTSNCLKSVT